MLSPGTYHRSVPAALAENLAYRRAVLLAARDSPAVQADLIRMCRDDVAFYASTFVWQINPKHVGDEVGPFVLWDFQTAALHETIDRLLGEWPDDILWEKSREMGATWLALILCDWLCLFHENKRVLSISHSEQAVDKAGSSGTLFAKIQFMHRRLPDWLRRGATKRKMGIDYPATASSNTGLATTARSGVGDRASVIVLDEFSKQQFANDIWGQTADTGPRLVIGTHYGVGTTFFDLTKRPDMKKVMLHWSQHPEKRQGLYHYSTEKKRAEVIDKGYEYPADYRFVLDGTPAGGPFPGIRSRWYDRECIRRANQRDVAMHLDIDAAGSVSQFFDALMIRSLVEKFCRPPTWEGALDFDRDTATPISLVAVKGGPLRLWVEPAVTASGVLTLPVGLYASGADIATGTGATPSVYSAADAKTGEKVLEYADRRINPTDFAALCVALSRMLKSDYGDGALFAWEHSGAGAPFTRRVLDLGYSNIFHRTDEFAIVNKTSDRAGWTAVGENKRTLLEEYRAALSRFRFINRSEWALKDALAFRYVPGGSKVEHSGARNDADPSAEGENHGDPVIADALACKMMLSLGIVGGKPELAPDGPPPGSYAWRRHLRRAEVQLEGAY